MDFLADTPIPVILVLAGVVFLILSLGSAESLKILQLTLPRISDSQRWPARIMGVLLLGFGFATTRLSPTALAPQPPIEIVMQIESAPGEAPRLINDAYDVNDGMIREAEYVDPDSTMTTAEESDILEFVALANLAETLSYSLSDPSYAALVFTDEHLLGIETAIDENNRQGVYYVPLFHTDDSYYTDIRMMSNNKIEVDGCEYWSGEYYTISDNTFVGSVPFNLVPQTINIEYIGAEWRITRVAFYNPPAFC